MPIDYAAASGIEVLFVFAAGNDRVVFDSMFRAALSRGFPNVMSVAAVDRLSNEASYSNFGLKVL